MDYLKLKWKMFYRANDLDRDGVITFKDAEILAKNYQEQFQPKGDVATKNREIIYQFYKEAYFLKHHDEVTEDQYIEYMTEAYSDNRDEQRKLLSDTILDTIRLFDENGDDKMSQDEYAVMFKCYGLDQLFDPSFLRAFPQVEPGQVLLTIIADCWTEYMFNDVKGKNDREKPYLYAYRLIHEI